MAKVNPVVRTLYLYIFATLGLVFLAIGSVRLLDMALRAVIFKQADAMERMEPPPPMMMRTRVEAGANDTTLSAAERAQLREILRDYEQWRERQRNIDPVTARRQRDAASSLAMILVGLPLYFYHWRLIRKETAARRRRTEAAPPGLVT